MSRSIKALNKIIAVGYGIQLNLGALLLLVIIGTISLGIVSRYIFNSPLTWTEELGIFCFTWLAFLGASVAAAKNKHVSINMLVEKLPKKATKPLIIFGNLLTLLFLTILIIGALRLLPQTIRHASIVLGIPKSLYYLPTLTTGAYTFLVIIRNTLELLAGIQPELHEISENISI